MKSKGGLRCPHSLRISVWHLISLRVRCVSVYQCPNTAETSTPRTRWESAAERGGEASLDMLFLTLSPFYKHTHTDRHKHTLKWLISSAFTAGTFLRSSSQTGRGRSLAGQGCRAFPAGDTYRIDRESGLGKYTGVLDLHSGILFLLGFHSKLELAYCT